MSYKKLLDEFESYKRRKGIKEMSKEALRWYFRNVAKYVSTASFSKTLDFGTVVRKPIPGRFYLYKYDPKLKEQLPYYDSLPLVLITSAVSDGWYGINFHYMPPAIRLRIMEGFYATLKNERLTERLRLKINWKRATMIAKVVAGDKYLKHSIKHYLANHVTSPLVSLDPKYWALCVFLPLSRFRKTDAQYIWRDV